GAKRKLMRTTRPFAHALLSIPDSTLEDRWRGLQPNVKRLLTTLDPLRCRSLTSVASCPGTSHLCLLSAGDVVRPATLVRLRGTWPRDAFDDPCQDYRPDDPPCYNDRAQPGFAGRSPVESAPAVMMNLASSDRLAARSRDRFRLSPHVLCAEMFRSAPGPKRA